MQASIGTHEAEYAAFLERLNDYFSEGGPQRYLERKQAEYEYAAYDLQARVRRTGEIPDSKLPTHVCHDDVHGPIPIDEVDEYIEHDLKFVNFDGELSLVGDVMAFRSHNTGAAMYAALVVDEITVFVDEDEDNNPGELVNEDESIRDDGDVTAWHVEWYRNSDDAWAAAKAGSSSASLEFYYPSYDEENRVLS